MKNKLGFTMVELIVTLIIVGIISIIAVPSYRGYVRESIATEGKALLGEINSAQQIYYARNGKYYAGSAGQTYGASFGVDARRNKYFKDYTITPNGDTYTAVTTYNGKSLTLKGSLTSAPEIVDNFTYTEE